MHLVFIISICLINSIHSKVFDTTLSSTLTSTTTQSTSFISSTHTSVSSTTYRPHYPDTFSPGSVTGAVFASIIFIILITMSSCFIRRRRIYYLPYYDNYRPI